MDSDHVVVALAAFSFVAATTEILVADDPGNLVVGITALFVLCLAFAASRRRPVVAALTLGVAFAGQSLLGGNVTEASGFLLVPAVGIIFVWGLRATERSFWLSAPVVVVGVLVAVISDAADTGDNVAAELAWVTVVFLAMPAAAGRMMRWRAQTNRRLEQQADELERNREARARAARLATRASIAGEVHDIVAHEVSVMVVQAQAARLGVERGRTDAASSIEAIELTGREALNEMRRLLGVLRHEDSGIALSPQPTLRRVDGLVTQARERGLDVRLDSSGVTSELPPAVDLTAYRIAQEALRSVTEHGGASRVDAKLATRRGHFEMDLESDGEIALAALAGLRERAEMWGGSVDVEPRERGGTLRIRIPLSRSYAEATA